MLWLWIHLTALVAVAQAGLFSKSHVLKLNGNNFREKVLNNDNVTVVEFYAPWCGHCKSSAPELKKSAKSLHGIARVGAVNCDASENKALCAHYKIQGFPTIKVFQPAKKSDRDFEAVNAGQEPKRRKHNVINYTGPRDSRSINKFAASKIRNYAATLDGDMSFVWLRANGIPRVVMLPGSNYKSKTIAPLFKTLSNEWFGKVRFAYIPRRADGGWNMLGLQAPGESTIVYMSDDKVPYVYKGELTKSKVSAFIQEQYELEMGRRKHIKKVHQDTDGDVGVAFGLEYVKEDPQEEPLIAVEREEKEFQENWSAYNFYINSAREKRARASASSEGVEYTPIPSTTVSIKYTRAWTPVDAPTSDPNLESFDDFSAKVTAAPSVIEDEGSVEDEEVEEAEIDDGESGTDTSLEDYTDAMLDQLDFDLAPEDIVAEGPEAVAAWKDEMEAKVDDLKESRSKQIKRAEDIARLRAEQQRKKRAKQNGKENEEEQEAPTPVQQLPPGITPKAVTQEKAPTIDDLSEEHYLEQNALRSLDDILENCVRRDITCILCSSSSGFVVQDIQTMLRTRMRFDSESISRMIFQFYDEDFDPELKEFSSDLKISPYSGVRKNPKGEYVHNAGLAIFDYASRQYGVLSDQNEYTVDDMVSFITGFLQKKNSVIRKKLPLKYIYYVTSNDIEVIERFGTTEDEYEPPVPEEAPEAGHDEL